MSSNNVKLLIADDEDLVRNSVANYIERNGTKIDTILKANDGNEALEMIRQYRPDLLLIDVQMPHLTGLEVIEAAQKSGFCPPTVVLSGYDLFKYAQQALRLGACDYMLKPCRPMQLLKKLEDLIDAGKCDHSASDQEKENTGNFLIDWAMNYIVENYNKDISQKAVAEKLGISSGYLSSLFCQVAECSFVDYINEIRIQRACDYLHDIQLKTYEVAYLVGYNDDKYFTKTFKRIKGLSPTQYRRTL